MWKKSFDWKKNAGLPISYTADYSEITENYLNQKYYEMLNQTFDFSSLLISNYDPKTQKNRSTRMAIISAPNSKNISKKFLADH